MDKLNNVVHAVMGGGSKEGSAMKKMVEHFLLKGRRSKSSGDSSNNSKNVRFVLLIWRSFLNLAVCALPED